MTGIATGQESFSSEFSVKPFYSISYREPSAWGEVFICDVANLVCLTVYDHMAQWHATPWQYGYELR